MGIAPLTDFCLVDGTALSLRYGHRTSIDLDLFNHLPFDTQAVVDELYKEFGKELSYRPKHEQFGIFCFISNVKVDIVRYPHAPISATMTEGGIRLYSDADICAMKIQAILGRGKKKDFWDIAELLRHYSLAQIMEWHKQKFPNQLLAIGIPQALLYFSDADASETPVSLKGQTWDSIKDSIRQAVSDYLK